MMRIPELEELAIAKINEYYPETEYDKKKGTLKVKLNEDKLCTVMDLTNILLDTILYDRHEPMDMENINIELVLDKKALIEKYQEVVFSRILILDATKETLDKNKDATTDDILEAIANKMKSYNIENVKFRCIASKTKSIKKAMKDIKGKEWLKPSDFK